MSDPRPIFDQNKSAGENKESGRPPLRPLIALQRRVPLPVSPLPEPLPSSGVFLTESEYEDFPQFLEMEDRNKFELMHVSVVIYGMAGIVCQKEPVKKKRSKFKIKKNDDVEGKRSSIKGSSGSTTSSTDVSVTEEGEFIDNPNAPTTAVVSFRKNAISSQHSLETFLPSLPLKMPTACSGMKSRYSASWPSDQSTLVKDDFAVERSSFKLIRCMQQESFVPGDVQAAGVPNYVHETVELRISLSRGTDLVPLGTASLVISGEEEGEILMNIPAKPLRHKSEKIKPKRFKSRKLKSEYNERGYFTCDPTRQFSLEHATLRVGVQVIPQHTLEVAEERKKQDTGLKQMWKKIGNEKLHRGGENPYKNFSLGKLKTAIASPEMAAPPTKQTSLLPGFPNFFCGAMLCAPSSLPEPVAVPQQNPIVPPEEIDISNDHRYQYGVNSLLSSVSESTDGSSDESDGETEFQMREFRTAAAAPRQQAKAAA
jgi:hypothetical protein